MSSVPPDDKARLRSFLATLMAPTPPDGFDARLEGALSGASRKSPLLMRAAAGLIVAFAMAAVLLGGYIVLHDRVHIGSAGPPVSSSGPPPPLASATPGSTPSPPSGSPTAAAATPTCTAAQLAARLTFAGGGGGHDSSRFTLVNVSATPCSLYGYPGVQLLSGSGQALATHATDGAGYVIQPETPARVVLSAHGEASFMIEGFEYTAGEQCAAASAVSIVPPGVVGSFVVKDSILATGPCGAITVSPIYLGNGPQPAS
jgi:Protein of unknown function (DUF4232)